MGISRTYWESRIAVRSDLTRHLTHLTRGVGSDSALKILLRILREKKLRKSDPKGNPGGYLIGKTGAVCFQDAPLHSVAQNLCFEGRFGVQLGKPSDIIRYEPCGLVFSKEYVYRRGGRPVIYDKVEEAKKYLQESDYWRIVAFDLSSDSNIIDWTHEREWRAPGDFEFDLREAHVLVKDQEMHRQFIGECKKVTTLNILDNIAGIITLSPLLL